MSGTNPKFDNFVDDLVNPALRDYDNEGPDGVKRRIDSLPWAAKQALKVALKEQITFERDPERLEKLQAVSALV